MSQASTGNSEAFNADADVQSEAAPGPYDPKLHKQLKALADHAVLSVELAERQIADLQEALEMRRQHAQDQADELRAYEDRHDTHQLSEDAQE